MSSTKTIDIKKTNYDASFFSEKTYVVTGAANGIGEALSRLLAKHHANVIMIDKDEARLNKLYDELEALYPNKVVIVTQDLANLSLEHGDNLAKQISANYTHLDGLIHCASETGVLAPLDHFELEDWQRAFKTNIHAAYLLTRSMLKIIESCNGKVVFSGSHLAHKNNAYWGAFSITSSALYALHQQFVNEFEKRPIGFAYIDPGEVKTAFMEKNYPGRELSSVNEAKDIAKAYLYILQIEQSGQYSVS